MSNVNYNVPNPFYGKDLSTLSPGVLQDNFIDDIIEGAEKGVKLLGKIFKKRKLSDDQLVKNTNAVAMAALAGQPIEMIRKVYEETKRTKNSYWDKDYAGKNHEQIARKAVEIMNMGLIKLGESPISFEDYKKAFSTGEKPGSIQDIQDKKALKIDPAFGVLEPFKSTMAKTLALEGITPSNRIDILANQFYNNIVVENAFDSFTGTQQYRKISLFNTPVDHADEAADAIITGIIQYITNLEKKKETGEPLSGLEETIVKGKEKATQKVEQIAKKEAASQTGEFLLFKGGWVWIAGAVVAIIVIVLAIKK